jgi:hypothetical protein
MSTRASETRHAFPSKLPRAVKRRAGASNVEQTPFAVRASGLSVSPELRRYVRARLGAKLRGLAPHIERLTARFEDINGPRGGVDIVCKIKVVLAGLPSVVVEERANAERPAFDAAADAVTRAVRKHVSRARSVGTRSRRAPRTGRAVARTAGAERETDPGSFIGRRVGRSGENLRAALKRPEKKRRDVPVDTAKPGVSATDRKAGGGSTARRNTKARTSKATATLEDSRRTRPSRKSTRKSANRTKGGTNLEARSVRRARSPKRRATKPAARAQ